MPTGVCEPSHFPFLWSPFRGLGELKGEEHSLTACNTRCKSGRFAEWIETGTGRRLGGEAEQLHECSYATTKPAIDLTTTSFLMFGWRMAGALALYDKRLAHVVRGSFRFQIVDTFRVVRCKAVDHSPSVPLATMRCNLVGNAYVELLGAEAGTHASIKAHANSGGATLLVAAVAPKNN